MCPQSGTDKLYGPANQAVSDAISSIRVVHAYGLRKEVVDLYDSKVSGTKSMVKKQAQIAGIANGGWPGLLCGT